jgi:hypothetical protein
MKRLQRLECAFLSTPRPESSRACNGKSSALRGGEGAAALGRKTQRLAPDREIRQFVFRDIAHVVYV